MKIFQGERYYNENGELGILMSCGDNAFASENLEMATDKRVIDFIMHHAESINNWAVMVPREKQDMIKQFLIDLGYDYLSSLSDIAFSLEFVPIGAKFQVVADEIRGDYGDFEGFCDELQIYDEDDWAMAE